MNELVKVYSSSNDIEVQGVLSLLSDNNIVFLKKDNGSGEYMRMYMGTSMFGTDIFVNQSDFEKAKELIEGLKYANSQYVEELDIEENNEEECYSTL